MLDNNNSFAREVLPTSRPAFVADRDRIVRDTGVQIDWDALGDEDYGPEGARYLDAGTVLALTSGGKAIPREVVTGGETCYAILATDAAEISETDAVSGFGVIRSGSIYENLLPEAIDGEIDAGWKTELKARGGFWLWSQYADTI